MVSDLGKFMIDVDWGMLMVLDAFPFGMFEKLPTRRVYVFNFLMGVPVVERIPAWIPFMHSKRRALWGNTLRREMEDSFFAWVQDQRVSHTISSNMLSPL